MKIGVVTCDGNEKWANCYESICNRCFKRNGDAELEYFHIWKGQRPTVESTKHLDALVCLGSAHMVGENLDWMADLSNFFLAIENSHVKVLAICFSHQLINLAYGGRVGKAECGFVFGTDKLKFDKSSLFSERFGRVVDKYRDSDGDLQWDLLQSHNDEVSEIGEGAVLVASSKRCKNEVVLVRDNILSMQCHPDLTSELMMEKIWPAILRKGFVKSELEHKARQEMGRVDTDLCLDFIRDFFTN